MKYTINYFKLFCFLAILLFTATVSAQPANDNCSSATSITALDGSCTSFNTSMSTFDVLNGDCVGPTNNNVWFSFVAQGPDIDIAVGSPSEDVYVTLISFDPNPCDFASATQLACGSAIGGNTAISLNSLSIGATYYVIANIGENEQSPGTICINNPDPNASPIPTLGQWGIMILSLILLILGVIKIRVEESLPSILVLR